MVIRFQRRVFLLIGLLLILLQTGNVLIAGKVSVSEASLVAKNFYFQKSGIANNIKYSELDLRLTYTGVDMLDTVYYVFSDIRNKGYVIISAEDKVKPILAYSNEGVFSGEDIPPACQYLLNSYSEQILFSKRIEYVPDNNIKTRWKEFISPNSGQKITETPSTPLILSHWSQGSPYNELCPEDIDGPAGHALVGCVAISMGQIMKYYNYPPQGSGSNSYYASGYGMQTVNFGSTEYEFYNMPYITGENNFDLAEFLYHCGVGAEMNYGADGSGAWVSTACQSMEDNFNYSSNWDYDNRNSYTDSQWAALLKNEIDNLRPMIYVGYTSTSGHAWNCDGYQNDLFHMNWGWGGSFDGFFSVDNLVVGGYNFYTGHKIAYNLYPGENYPVFCGAVKEIVGVEGSFDDGSGPEKYNNSTDCFWEIVPECGENIYIEFDFFDVKIGDTLFIYDGLTISSPLLAALTGENVIPEDLFSDKGGVLLNFVSNSDSAASGWTISYSVDFCSGNRDLYEMTGTISDGSSDCNYKDASMCNWTINPHHMDSVLIEFTEFDLYADIDNVKIFRGKVHNDSLVVKYTHADIPQSLMVYSEKVIVYFFTNGTGNGEGWSLDYTAYTSPDNINEIDNSNILNVYPNPVSDFLNIYIDTNDEVSINIFNTLGEIVYSNNSLSQDTNFNLQIDCSDYPNGVYFIQCNSQNSKTSAKFIKN